MKKINDRGSSPIILVLALAVIVLAIGAGYLVYKSQSSDKGGATSQKSSAPQQKQDTKKDETANWKRVESIGGAFTIKVPDGWELFSYPGNTINGDQITYASGKPTVIKEEPQAYAGDHKKFNVAFSNEIYDAPQWQTPNPNGKESSNDYSIGDLKGKKYCIEWLESVTGVNKGDRICQYVFNMPNGKQLSISYSKALTEPDNATIVEQVIQTINVKQ